MRRNHQTDLEAVFAARGWLAEHPATFRSLLVSEGVPVDVRAGTCVFRRDDESNGLYGIVSGAIGVEGGHRRQSPLLGHVMRTGEWFGIKAMLHGGPRELTYRAMEPSQPAVRVPHPAGAADADRIPTSRSEWGNWPRSGTDWDPGSRGTC